MTRQYLPKNSRKNRMCRRIVAAMQRTFSHSIVVSLLVAGMMTAVPAQAQTPSLIPADGCIDENGEISATCDLVVCVPIFFDDDESVCDPPPDCGVWCAPVPITCNFHTGQFAAFCIPAYLAYLISVIFALTGAIFLLMIILGGYQYVIGKAGGGGGEEGKARVRFAIIGFLVTALAFYIVDFVLSAL